MNKANSKIKVLCAMSGGVDSSVAAGILKKQGYEVLGVFLKFWAPKEKNTCYGGNTCCDDEALRSARAICEQLKIPFYVFDVAREFKKDVVDYYIAEYDSGRTPNPCVVCNKKIKFGWLIKKAEKLGCDFVASGHYARIQYSRTEPQKDEHFFHGAQASGKRLRFTFCDSARLFKAMDKKKDQSYFLWQLSEEELKHILFPIGDYIKQEVRKMAKKWGLPTAQKPESQDICFVPNGENTKFLHQYAKKLNQPGKITDLRGQSLGRHQGLINYTIGQRHGLGGIQLKTESRKLKAMPPAAFVIKLNIEKNQLVVGREQDLYVKILTAEDINWLAGKPPKFSLTYQAKIRYGAKAESCQLSVFSDRLKITFNHAQRAITAGQSVVVYKGKELIGGGIIK